MGSNWIKKDQDELGCLHIWFQSDKIGPNWFNQDQLDQIRSTWVRIGSYCFKLDQTGSNWIKIDKDESD